MLSLDRLTDQQREVVESWGQGLAVLAGAGSGKTSTLVVKCVELLRRKPDAKFAAVSFTEKSAADLQRKLAMEISLNGHWVTTIHGLCGKVIKEFPQEAGFDGDEAVLSETEAESLWRQALDALWTNQLSDEIQNALDSLLRQESRSSLLNLLTQLRRWDSFGVKTYLEESSVLQEQNLLSLSTYVLELYNRLKSRRGVIDFEDLEKGAHRALEHASVRQRYQQKFDLVMIDEFQDTNPMQAQIVWRFVRPDAANLVVVGDPKQSIYRFRDADVSLFEERVSQLPAKKELSWNFRSRPEIIHFVNGVCAPAFSESEMEYQALEPKRPSGEESSVLQLNLRSPDDLARWIQGEVAKGVPLEDMLLLMRKVRGGSEKWLRSLSAAGIPLAVGSGGRFWEDPRVRELASLIRAWNQPDNQLSAAIFLRAPWVAVSDEVIDEWCRQKEPLMDLFLAHSHSLSRRLSLLKESCVRPGQLLMCLMEDDRLAAFLGNSILGLWHRCEEWSARGWSFGQISRQLQKAMDEGQRQMDIPPPHQLGQLTVLTVHGSKGLEFPHVIIVDLEGRSRSSAAPALFWDRQQGVHLAGRLEDGSRDTKSKLEQQWRGIEKSKNLAESKRVFYVALTRAQERLVLARLQAGEEGAQDKELELGNKVLQEENWRGWIDFAEQKKNILYSKNAKVNLAEVSFTSQSDSKISSFEGGQDRSTASEKFLIPLKRSRHSVSEWNLLLQCPRAYEYRYIRPPVVPVSKDLGSGLGLDEKAAFQGSASELGTRVHACLEKRDLEGLENLEKEVGNPNVFRAQPLVDWVKRSPLIQQHSEVKDFAEFAFEIPLKSGDGDVVVGAIDHLRLYRDSKIFLLDYKVNIRRRSPEELLDSYQTQMEIYAWAAYRLAQVGQVEAFLIQISPEGVFEVPVPLPSDLSLLEEKLLSVYQQAQQVIQGQELSLARPSKRCQYCDFRSSCPEGRRSTEN